MGNLVWLGIVPIIPTIFAIFHYWYANPKLSPVLIRDTNISYKTKDKCYLKDSRNKFCLNLLPCLRLVFKLRCDCLINLCKTVLTLSSLRSNNTILILQRFFVELVFAHFLSLSFEKYIIQRPKKPYLS